MNGATKITVSDDITLVNLIDIPTDLVFASEIFGLFASHNINIDMISQSTPSSDQFNLSFTVPGTELENTLVIASAIREKYPKVKIAVNSGNSKIELYDEEMKNTYGVAYKAMKALADAKVIVNLITTSEVEISFLISSVYTEIAVEAFAKVFQAQ